MEGIWPAIGRLSRRTEPNLPLGLPGDGMVHSFERAAGRPGRSSRISAGETPILGLPTETAPGQRAVSQSHSASSEYSDYHAGPPDPTAHRLIAGPARG